MRSNEVLGDEPYTGSSKLCLAECMLPSMPVTGSCSLLHIYIFTTVFFYIIDHTGGVCYQIVVVYFFYFLHSIFK